MVSSPSAALAAGGAGAAGAGLLLTGRLAGSAITALGFVIAARTGAIAASRDPTAPSLLGLQATVVPAWVMLATAAVLRAGSVSLADVRGAHAVAGVALIRGNPALVAAAWLGLLAAVLAVAAPLSGPKRPRLLETPAPGLEVVSVGLQLLLAVTFFAGPQLARASDAIVWAGALAGSGIAVWLLAHLGRRLLARAAAACAAAALLLSLIGPPL